MNAKRITATALAAAFAFSSLLTLTGCGEDKPIRLRVYNWEEYIDEGGEGSYQYDIEENEDAQSLIYDFEIWYEETYGTPVTVEYSTFGTNEDMYNQLKLGDQYDLICPSDYMIMKLAAEDMLEPFTEDFFDAENELNYYIANLSPYIKDVFDSNTVTLKSTGEKHSWSEYAAGYMWGTTGFIYNPEYVSPDELDYWDAMIDSAYANKVTTKDNVRDSYFVGTAILYQDELLDLRDRYQAGEIDSAAYNHGVTEIMNRTDEETVSKVQDILLDMKDNIYGFETDTGKSDMVKGIIWLNFAWSGDAVYAIDLAEYGEGDEELSEDEAVYLNYYIPEECANLWFDGWVMPKGAQVEAAQAFINFLSRPDNAVRNMYYIGYTPVIAADEVYEYVEYTYGVEEGDEEDAVEYDLSYFFGKETVLLTYEDQLERQLYGQYPTKEVMHRCAVMDYFDDDANERINELWTKVKGSQLDAWAIAVICVGVVGIAAFALLFKFGGKIDWFRRKPKKGYELVDQKPYRHD